MDKYKETLEKIECIMKIYDIKERSIYEEVIEGIFLKEMGFSFKNIVLVYNEEKNEITIQESLLLKASTEEKVEKALTQLTIELEFEDALEWGILFHPRGIWLVNSDIEVDKEDFRSQKIVLEIIFGSNSDTKYFKYFSYDNILNQEKNACYFRDIISYKNKDYNGNKKSWKAYHTTIKRFLDFYANNFLSYSSRENGIYNCIHMRHFERYIREGTKVLSIKTVRNNFFYLKGFLVSRGNKEFNKGAEDITKLFPELRSEENTNDEMNLDKLNIVFANLKRGRNSERNIVLLLLLLSFGIERRKLCFLEWNNVQYDNDSMVLKLDNIVYPIPETLARALTELRGKYPGAQYILGNSGTKYSVPLKEESINSMLSGIAAINPKDNFYGWLTPANIRKWLAQYLLKAGYPLQEIMQLMDISISNLGNYFNDELLESVVTIPNQHPMEEFLDKIDIRKEEVIQNASGK